MISGKPGPKWVSWSNKNQHLSSRFHSSSNGFEDFIKWLKTMPYCTHGMMAYPQSRVLLVCLGIGMVLHDLYTIQFELGEEDEDSGDLDPAIKYLKKSKLEWAHTQALLQMCLTIAGDLRECLDGQSRVEESVGAIPEPREAASKRQKKVPAR
jgi:hypothetical protein